MAQDNSNPQQGASFLHTGRRGPPPHRRDDRKLFVGGLPANITSEEFEEFFGQFGKLVDSVVMFDRETQRSRGFGFVTYQDPKVCQKLLLMGNQDADPSTAMSLVGRIEMQGKVCEIKAATPRETTIRPRNDESKRTPTTADSANTMSGPRLTRPAVDGYGYPPTSTNMTFAPTMVPPPLIYYPPPYATPHGYTSFVPYPPQQPGYATFPDFPPLYTAENAAPPPPIMTHQYPVLGIPSHPAPTPVLPAAMITLPAPAVVALVDPHLPPSTSLGHSNNSNKDNMIPTGASHSDVSVSLPHPLVPLPPPPPVSANVDSSSAENTNPTATAMPTFHATTATSSLSFYPPFHHQDPTFAMAPFAAPQSHKNDSKLKDVEGTDPQLPYQSLESR